MIFIDANIPMYLVGGDHPNKIAAAAAVDRAIDGDEPMVTDAEVLQEILHRFIALRRPDAVQAAFDALLKLVEQTFPIDLEDLLLAKDIALGGHGSSGRDCLHVAVMRRYGIDTVMTLDKGFERYPGIRRLC